MGSDDPTAPPFGAPPWAHRSWCAPGCEFRSGAVEGAHLGAPWVLAPAGQDPGGIALRLVEEVMESGTGEVRVLVSVTERRLADDLDPFGEAGDQAGGRLADITSSVDVSAQETGQLFEQLVAFARSARELSERRRA
ncbi:MAG: hypothetical protein ACRDR6_30155 [Pseudonocardiaceae bacterium]